jgi:hypothetical protein
MKKLGLVLILVASARIASAQTVLARARIGNNIEGMTFVGSGPLASSVVFVDGYQLRSVSAEPCGLRCGVQELLDLKTLSPVAKINGIAYISAEKKFVLLDFGQPNTWLVLDSSAHPLAETRTLTHLPGLSDNGGEGMVYVPLTARRFGDRIIASTYDSGFVTHLEVFRRDGMAVAEIVPRGLLDPSLESIIGLGYMAPDKLLVGTLDNFLWVMDFDGNVVQGPIDAGPDTDFEGVVQTADGRVVAAAYGGPKLLFFDRKLNRLPNLDRDVQIGIGRSRPQGAAWDRDTQSILVDPVDASGVQEIDALPTSLDSFVQVTPLSVVAAGLTYLDSEQRIGMCRPGPRAIWLFDNSGNQTEQVAIENPAAGNLVQVTFIPTRSQFAFRLGPGSTMLHFATRTGDFVRDIDLSALGIGALGSVAFFPAGPFDPNPDGNLAIADGGGKKIVFMDVDATTVLGEVDYADIDLRAVRLGYIDDGPLAGSFIAFDQDNSEIVIFRP